MEKLSFQEWADILKSFYEDNGPEYKTATIEHIKETILTSPMAEETFIEDDEALEIAQQVAQIWRDEEEEEEEITAFNDVETFIKEYGDYLNGKNILYSKGYKLKILPGLGNYRGNLTLPLELNGDTKSETIKVEDLKRLIDGEEIEGEEDNFSLVLQEDKEDDSKNKSLNKSEYNYYILRDLGGSNIPSKENRKVVGGFKYFEDADKETKRLKEFGEKVYFTASNNIDFLDLNDNSNWETNYHDWDIISKCLNKCSDEGGCSPKEAAKYLKEFKEEGKYLNVIKGALLQCLERAQIKLRGAYAMSNLESVNEKCDENCRIQKELKRLIAMEK